MLRPGSMMMRLAAGSSARAWADHRLGVGVKAGRMFVVGIAHAETAAEVVDVESAELGDGFDRGGQLFDIEQL